MPGPPRTRRAGPLAGLGLLLILTIGLGLLARDVRPRYRVEDFFPQNTPQRAAFDRARQSFGRDDRTAALILQYPAPLTTLPDAWSHLAALSHAVAALPGIEAVHSPALARLVTTNPQSRRVLRAADQLPLAQALAQLAGPPFQDALISKDQTVAVVAAVLARDHLDYPSRAALKASLERLARRHAPTARVRIGGYPIHRVILTDLVRDESRRLAPWVLAAIAAVLALMFRSLAAVLLPLAVAVLAAVWTTGLMALLHLPPNILSPGVYILVAVMGVADTVHLLARRNLRAVALPCALSSLTTAVGFGALWLTGIPMIAQFGLQVALGVGAALAITFLLLPPFLPLLRRPPPRLRVLDRVYALAVARPRRTVALSLLAMLACALLTTQIRINSPLLADLDPDHPVRETYTFVEQHLGGVIPLDVLIAGPPETLYAKPSLDRIQAFERAALRLPDVLSAQSPVDLLHHLAPLLRKVPPREVTGLLPTALLLAPDELRGTVDPERDLIRVRLRVKNLDTAGAFRLFDQLDRLYRHAFDNTPITLTGQGLLGQTVNQTLVHHFGRGFLLALFLVSILLWLALRRARLAALALLPNLLPLLAVTGLMGAAGIDLRYTSALVLTVVFSLAVDDTIHLLTAAAKAPLQTAYREAGPGILLTSLVLAAGFLVLLSSDFVPNRVMGLLLAVCTAAAALGDLVLLPALLTLWPQARPKR